MDSSHMIDDVHTLGIKLWLCPYAWLSGLRILL